MLKALLPTTGTASPSAKVDDTTAATGSPASNAAENDGHRTGSTPITSTDGFSV